MTELLHDIDAPSDAELISRVRGGDVAAYGDLFARHVDAARRLARQLVRGPDADDLVSDAFAKVLGVLQGGGGPDVAFRAYLLTAVRRLHVDKIRAGSKLQTSDDMEAFDAGIPFQDTAVAAFESGAAAKAFASLPERWQLVLWHLEVEGQKPADIAPLLGMSANSVSALAYRAREGLRQAFLTMHLNDTSDTSCRWVNEHLGAYVRKGLAKRDATKVQTHLDECRRCTAMYLELTEVNSNLRGIIAPLLLGAAAAGYLSSTGAAGGGFGLVALFGRARDAVTANAGAATAGAVAAGVAAVATAGIMLLPSSGPEDTVTGADDSIGQVTTPGAPSGEGSPGGGREAREDGADDAAGEDDGTAAAEEPALDATPEAVPVSDVGAESTEGGGSSSETGGETGGGPGGAPGGETDPNQPPGDEPGPNEPPGEEPPAPPGEEPAPPPGEEPPPPPGEEPPPPPPGEEEPPSSPVSVNVTVGGSATLGENSVSFEISAGTDVLPPTVEIDLESDPEGITFGSSTACTPSSGGTTVVCSTTSPATELLSASFLRALVSTDGVPTIVTAPLVIPAEQPTTRLRFTLDLPSEFTDPDPTDNVATATYTAPTPPPTTADVSLDLPTSVAATEALDYTVPVTIDGVPDDYAGPLTFHLSSVPPREAVFVGDELCEVHDQGSKLVCSKAPSTFTVRVKNNNDPTNLTITLEPLVDLPDPVEGNNTASTTLEAFRGVDLKVSAVPDLDGNAGKGTIGLTVEGAPADPVVVTAAFDAQDLVMTTWPGDCTPSAGLVTCRVDGAQILSFDFGVALVDRPVNETHAVTFHAQAPGYTETQESDNTVVVPVERKLGGAGSGGSASTTTQSTVDGLAPSDATSPVARTLEVTVQTITKVAEDVTRAERRERKSGQTTTSTEPSNAANKKVSSARSEATTKPTRVRPEKATSTPSATSRVTGTDRRDAVREGHLDRPESKDQESSADDRRGQRETTDTTSPTAGTTSDERTTDVVDTVVKAVKNLL